MTLLTENPRLGVPSCNTASLPGRNVRQTTAALGLSWSVVSGTRQSEVMGRFLSSDWSPSPTPVPYADLNNPQSLNLYGYVSNNPLSRIDPDGHRFVNGLIELLFQCLLGDYLAPWAADSALGKKLADDKDRWQLRTLNGLNHSAGKLTNRGEVNGVLRPNFFYSASVEAGPFSQSASYVPSTNNFYYSPGVGTGSGISLTAGWATDPNGFAGGLSGSGCFFAGAGGCGGISTSGDWAIQAGVGVGAWGAAGGYGVDPIQTIGMGMAEGEAVDPLATKVGDVYMEDPQMWIPPN